MPHTQKPNRQNLQYYLRAKTPLVLTVLIILSGSTHVQSTPNTKTEKQTLYIASAANFKPALKEILKLYNSHMDPAESTFHHQISSGSTAQLTIQIQNGAPYHLFFAADQRSIDQLDRSKHSIKSTRMIYAKGELAYWRPTSTAQVSLASLQTALLSQEKLVIANPKLAPYGIATAATLTAVQESKGLPAIEPANLITANNIAHAFQLLYKRQLLSGFVALSLLKARQTNPQEYWLVDERFKPPIFQVAVVLNRARGTLFEQEAVSLLNFIRSAQVQSLLIELGYSPGPQT